MSKHILAELCAGLLGEVAAAAGGDTVLISHLAWPNHVCYDEFE